MQRTQFRGNMSAGNGPVNTATVVYTCGRCAMFYYDYKQLVEHLYWRHGTESLRCKQCGLKRWQYAAHVCNILPIDPEMTVDFDVDIENTKPVYCYCGEEVDDAPMIGCDYPHCRFQWYHFKCVGIVTPPEGDWYCPQCLKLCSEIQNKSQPTEAQT